MTAPSRSTTAPATTRATAPAVAPPPQAPPATMSYATTAAGRRPRRLIVLGCTGSIGVNTIDVVEHLARIGAADIRVVGLAASRSVERLAEQARRLGVKHLAIAETSLKRKLEAAVPGATVHAGPDAAVKLVMETQATDLAAAMVGSAGLAPTLAGIERGLTVSLANKETLVAAGSLVRPLLARYEATLIPVDSEHSAIFQCLREHPRQRLKRIVLTASGGPFRNADQQTIANATVEQALKHPTWQMGRKITIDSATMMNKALEIIEAHWLFELAAERIDVIIHPESIVHSFVEFADHSILAQLGEPDMRGPIQYALTCPDRPAGCGKAMDWSRLSQLNFHAPDAERFPALRLAYDVIRRGGTAGAVLNAANEAAVAAFLERRIRFGRISELAAEALGRVPIAAADSLDGVLEADRAARAFVAQQLE
ncbi:MAG: 1-deoxy-D-xylulose-5-phosphate reductoisomerase [Phycisphaeraceae bacterium]